MPRSLTIIDPIEAAMWMDLEIARSQGIAVRYRRAEESWGNRETCPIYYRGRAIFHSSRPLDLLGPSLCSFDFQLGMRFSRDLNNVFTPFLLLVVMASKVSLVKISWSPYRWSRAFNSDDFLILLYIERKREEYKIKIETSEKWRNVFSTTIM